jgi:tetratricopeptide (TPR) repeat protein
VAAYQLERGRRLFLAARFRESFDASSAARELAPGDPLPDELRARALLALGRDELAERSFAEYLYKGGPAKSDIFRARGLARMKLGKFSAAVDDYTRALDLAPDAEIYQHRGWAHFFADAWKLALRDFAAAIALDPAAADAFAGRGLAQVMLGNYREAVMDAETSIRRDPRTPEMMHNVACILAQAAARAEADSRQSDRQILADSYRRRAVHAVHETLARVGPQDRAAFLREKIVPDAALDPIRNEADFKLLQGRYRKL